MKKMLSIVFAMLLCICAVLPVFADSADSEVVARLILSAKEKLKISDEEYVFSDYYHSETEKGNRYDLSWESKDETNSSGISVEIGENGTIYRYNFYDSAREYGQLRYPKHTEDEALSAAKEFFAVIDGEKAKQVIDEEITYESYDNTYVYNATRAHGAIPVFGNRVSIQLDADSLKTSYYYANWDEQLEFESGNAISFEQAVAAYKDKIGYELFYQVVSEEHEDTVRLVYRPKYDETLYIDAISGEAVDFEQLYGETGSGGSNAAMSVKEESAADSAARLSEEERAMVDEIAQMLPKEKAENIARAVNEFNITDDYSVSSYNINKDSHGKYTGRISFRMESDDGEKYGYKNVLIDAKTGKVMSYNGYSYPDKENSGAELTEEQAHSMAEDFLKKYYPDELAQMEKKAVFKQQAGRVVYQRVLNGLKIYNNGASIYINTKNKQISSFSLEWTDAAAPDAGSAAATDKMYEKLLGADAFRCGYIISYDNKGKAQTAKLVYTMEEKPILDAVTLEKLNHRLQPTKEEKKPDYTDVSGHYAEEAAEKLLVMGIYYPEEKLRPDDAVTQKEYLGLISQVVFSYEQTEDEDAFYNYMLRRGVLSKEDIRPDETITRMEGIRYLLNALDYGEFAKIPGIFNCPFNDVAEEDKGYGAIAAGLKLVYSGTDTFYSGSSLKRGDSLIIIYNYLMR